MHQPLWKLSVVVAGNIGNKMEDKDKNILERFDELDDRSKDGIMTALIFLVILGGFVYLILTS